MKEEISKREFAEIEVGRINPSPYQHRKQLTDIEGLAENIRRHGILNPLTVRFVNGDYELIAGHRRLEAAEIVGFDTVPAIVIVCDDREAAEMCVTENMQRCNLTPLEEADGVAALLSTGHEIQDVADRLGRSRQWVARRAGLLKLCSYARKQYEDSESPFSLVPVEGLELIAALPAEIQETVSVKVCYGVPTLFNVKQIVADSMQDLENARFDKTECKTCSRRTGAQPDLFDEVKSKKLGRCTDRGCFFRRCEEDIKQKIADLKTEPNVIIYSENPKICNSNPEVKQKINVVVCDREEPGSVEAWEIKTNGELQAKWVMKQDEENSEQPETEEQPTDEDKHSALICDAVTAMIEATLDRSGVSVRSKANNPLKEFSPENLIKLMCAGGNWRTALDQDLDEVADTIWPRLSGIILNSIKVQNPLDCYNEYIKALDVAEVFFGKDKEEVESTED